MTTKVSPEEIPEVASFLEADEQLQTFVDSHRKIFDQFSAYAENRNQLLEAAEKVVRARKVSCGPIVQFSEQIRYNWKAMFDFFGGDKDTFMNNGGKINRVTKYDGNREIPEVKIKTGEISEEDAEVFRTVSPRYKTPDKITIL